MIDSFPFLHLARELCLPYGDVLLAADHLAGNQTAHTDAAIGRLHLDATAIRQIDLAVDNEQRRRAVGGANQPSHDPPRIPTVPPFWFDPSETNLNLLHRERKRNICHKL